VQHRYCSSHHFSRSNLATTFGLQLTVPDGLHDDIAAQFYVNPTTVVGLIDEAGVPKVTDSLFSMTVMHRLGTCYNQADLGIPYECIAGEAVLRVGMPTALHLLQGGYLLLAAAGSALGRQVCKHK
jgi:hypothetical protein